jgi:murein DD-endopeptidase MepM/ murein hydrolase activator NlpD
MIDRLDTVLYKARFVITGALILASILFFTLLLSGFSTDHTVEAADPTTPTNVAEAGFYDSPNAVTSGLSMAADRLSRSLDSTDDMITGVSDSVSDMTDNSAEYIAAGAKNSGDAAFGSAVFVSKGGMLLTKGYLNYLSFYGRTLASIATFSIQTPGRVLGLVSNAPVVSSVIKPSDNTPIPVITPGSPILFEAHAAIQAVQQITEPAPAPVIESETQWPMHGRITTHFGVPHWPWQATHTGIDISDGQRSGVTGIKPIKPGKVVGVVRSGYGLGNHVTIDHGNGLSSVYAHLSSITVQMGQLVDKNSVIGYEGSTGASTGTHLHLEVLVNGVPVDPRQFVLGHP